MSRFIGWLIIAALLALIIILGIHHGPFESQP